MKSEEKLIVVSVLALTVLFSALVLVMPRIGVCHGVSMEPAIYDGNIVFGYPPTSFESLKVGDILSFVHYDGTHILHRITEIVSEDEIITSGDNCVEYFDNGVMRWFEITNYSSINFVAVGKLGGELK